MVRRRLSPTVRTSRAETGDGVTRRVGLLALGAAAQILHVGHGAEQVQVAHVGVLGDQGLESARLAGSAAALCVSALAGFA